MQNFLLDSPAFGDGNKWVVYALAGATILYVVLKPLLKKKDPLDKKKPAYASLASERSVERQMQSLLVELSEMSRQISGQLDNRATKLELLIREADEKIAELKALQQSQQTGAKTLPPRDDLTTFVPSDRPAPPPPRLEPEAQIIDPRHMAVYQLADRGLTPADIARDLGRPRGEVDLILALRPR